MRKNYIMPLIKVKEIGAESLLVLSGAGSDTFKNGSGGGGDNTMQTDGTGGVAPGGTESEAKQGHTWDSWD